MATGPGYRRPLRRRVEGKTDYKKRLKLIKSGKLRAVIRASEDHMIVQFIKSKYQGDKVIISGDSKELPKKFDYDANTGNVPAAYLTGYLAGVRAKEEEIEEAILDLGIFYHKNRVFAAFKGIIDAGITIPHRDKFFPEGLEERLDGSHIEDYAKLLKKEEPEKYEKVFSGYLDKNINPLKFTQIFENTLKKIENSV